MKTSPLGPLLLMLTTPLLAPNKRNESPKNEFPVWEILIAPLDPLAGMLISQLLAIPASIFISSSSKSKAQFISIPAAGAFAAGAFAAAAFAAAAAAFAAAAFAAFAAAAFVVAAAAAR